jgi:hypothetical protein
MNKNTATETAQNETMDLRSLFGGGNLKLETTPKAVTPFAGMVSFFAWLGALGFERRVAKAMPFSYESPNAIAPE